MSSLLFLSLLLLCSSVPAAVRVSPDRSQFFSGESLSVRCEDRHWTLRRNTSRDTRSRCGDAWGTLVAAWCEINRLYSGSSGLSRWDSGLYWCESREGQALDRVNISVKDRGVVLQSPVLPVTEGQTVSLSCLHHTSSNLPARFHRDGHFLSEQPTGHMTIQQVSASDEGLYQCEIQGELSESSWIHVRPGKPQTLPSAPSISQAPPSTSQTPPLTSQTPPPASGRPPVLALLCHLVVFCPYVVSTVLMVSLLRTRTRETGSAAPVAVETAPPSGLRRMTSQPSLLSTISEEPSPFV